MPKKIDKWLEGDDPQSRRERLRTKQRALGAKLAAEVDAEIRRAIKREIRALEAEGIEKPFPYTPREGTVSTGEMIQSLEEGLSDFEEAFGELGTLKGTVEDSLRDRANDLAVLMPNSTTATEAQGILESAVEDINKLLEKLGAAKDKWETLKEHLESMP